METIVEPNIRVFRKGVLIKSSTKLGSGSGRISARRNLSWSSALPTTIIEVVGIPQMVFTNSITVIHHNKATYRPLISSMALGGCKNADVVHSKGGYSKPITVTTPIFYHTDGHYVRPNF